MAGAFIISRDIFENPIWTRTTEFRLFFLILGKAIYLDEGYDVGEIHLNKGQWLRSYRNLQSDLEYVENHAIKRPGLATIKRTIEKLVADERVTIQPTELGTLFTVLNYAKYQNFEEYKKGTRNSAKNSSGPDAEQMRNNNKKDNQDNQENNIILFPPEETEPLKPLVDAESFFREHWSTYPNKKGQVSKTQKEKLFKLGDELKRCISRYLAYVDSERKRGFDLQYKNGSTFFNNGYKDFLDSVFATNKPDTPDCSNFTIKYVDQDPIPESKQDSNEVDF